MNYSDSIKAILLAAINELSKIPENYAVKPGVDFIRNRKLGFKDYMLMFLTMEADCIREALHKLGNSDSSILRIMWCSSMPMTKILSNGFVDWNKLSAFLKYRHMAGGIKIQRIKDEGVGFDYKKVLIWEKSSTGEELIFCGKLKKVYHLQTAKSNQMDVFLHYILTIHAEI